MPPRDADAQMLVHRVENLFLRRSSLYESSSSASSSDGERSRRSKSPAGKGPKPAAKRSSGKEEFPPGKSIAAQVFHRDPSSLSAKILILSVTAAAMLLIPFIDVLLADFGHAAADAVHTSGGLLGVLEHALELTGNSVLWHFRLACVPFVLLICAHFLGAVWPARWYDAAANPHAVATYEEMFSEPLSQPDPKGQRRFLIARWGNTLSNFVYFATSTTILHSVASTWGSSSAPYSWADGLFGLNLLLLSVFSVVWHGSNYNKEHYLDLWAMDHAILYLILRFAAFGASLALGERWVWVPPVLFCFYGATFLASLKNNLEHSLSPFGEGKYDTHMAVSGRRRLAFVHDDGTPDIGVLGMCLFGGLPVLYLVPAASAMHFSSAAGSLVALRWVSSSLAIGWSYRMLERFCVDGNGPMAAIAGRLEKTPRGLRAATLRFVAALISPTAVLHWTTGITLLAGFVHVRTVDHQLCDEMSIC
jgi:hypothetical protein